MTSYTNARPGVGLLVVDLDPGAASRLHASRRRTDVARLVFHSMALGPLYPYGTLYDSGVPMNEREVRTVRSKAVLKPALRRGAQSAVLA